MASKQKIPPTALNVKFQKAMALVQRGPLVGLAIFHVYLRFYTFPVNTEDITTPAIGYSLVLDISHNFENRLTGQLFDRSKDFKQYLAGLKT